MLIGAAFDIEIQEFLNDQLGKIENTAAMVEMSGVGVSGIGKHAVKVHIAIADKAVNSNDFTGGDTVVGDKIYGIFVSLYDIEGSTVQCGDTSENDGVGNMVRLHQGFNACD